MDLRERLYTLRKERGISQEELANVVGVSRQAVQKWEAGTSIPDVDNLSALAEYFQVTLDYLVRGVEQSDRAGDRGGHSPHHRPMWGMAYYEYKSHRTLWGLPLVHIKFGYGICRAKGIVAIGNLATGLVALGGISAGLLSIGGTSLGLLALGGVSLGGLAVGGLSVGLAALGGCAIGVLALGGAAVGTYAAGGGALGAQIAIGDAAHSAGVAIGNNLSGGGLEISREMAASLPVDALCDMARPHVPHTPEWLLRLMMGIARHF